MIILSDIPFDSPIVTAATQQNIEDFGVVPGYLYKHVCTSQVASRGLCL